MPGIPDMTLIVTRDVKTELYIYTHTQPNTTKHTKLHTTDHTHTHTYTDLQ